MVLSRDQQRRRKKPGSRAEGKDSASDVDGETRLMVPADVRMMLLFEVWKLSPAIVDVIPSSLAMGSGRT
jgi:hypothetical protein